MMELTPRQRLLAEEFLGNMTEMVTSPPRWRSWWGR